MTMNRSEKKKKYDVEFGLHVAVKERSIKLEQSGVRLATFRVDNQM